MLFLGHLDDMHGVGLLWKVTLWGLFLNSQNQFKSYWYWVIALWTHTQKSQPADDYSWEVWAGKYIGITEWKPSQNLAFDKQYIRKLVFYTYLSNFMSKHFQKKYTWETPNDPL